MVDRFCRDNGLDVIVRAHECVQAGFEYFARGHLITVFSATNYCGQSGNQGALLHVVDRGADWLIIPKVIEPQGAGAWYVVREFLIALCCARVGSSVNVVDRVSMHITI